MASDNKTLWLIPIAILLFAFRKPKATTSCVIVPDEAGAVPLYGGDSIIKLKPNSKIYERANIDSNVIATKSCYVEGIVLRGNSQWIKVINRPAFGETDFTGYLPITSIQRKIYG